MKATTIFRAYARSRTKMQNIEGWRGSIQGIAIDVDPLAKAWQKEERRSERLAAWLVKILETVKTVPGVRLVYVEIGEDHRPKAISNVEKLLLVLVARREQETVVVSVNHDPDLEGSLFDYIVGREEGETKWRRSG